MLLDIALEVLPLGTKECSTVAQQYNKGTEHSGSQPRDVDAVKKKFEKMAAVKKPSGDPICHPHVCQAKQAAGDMLARANAGNMGSDDDSDVHEGGADVIDVLGDNIEEPVSSLVSLQQPEQPVGWVNAGTFSLGSSSICRRRQSRKTGEAGTPANKMRKVMRGAHCKNSLVR